MSGSVPQKIVLKSTTKLSLNERFSNLHKPNPNAVQTARSNIAAERQASAQNRRLAMQMAHRPQVVAAMKLKKKSLRQRLGVQARITPRQPMRGRGNQNMQGTRGFQQPGRYRGRGRGFVTQRGSARGMRSPRGRPFVVFRGRGGRFRGQSRGQPRGQGMRGRGRGQMRGGPRFRGGRGRGFRGQGFRGQRRPGRGGPRGRGGANKEALDNELDTYMSKTKSVLDNELDSYMASGNQDM